ncbi:MAG: translation elongation factor Ts [Rickettsiales bacterium]|nr:MAG: translation elongation factor Ts [Rickettsiales bacterium]
MANMDLLKKLRENTGCGMSDCNKALNECADNYDEAVQWLRKKGLSTAAKKSSRVATEGVVGILNNGNVASILEVNAETDFVARNEKFQDFVRKCLNECLSIEESDEAKFVETLKGKTSGSNTIAEALVENIAVIGENLQIRRGKTFKQNKGLITSYVHSSIVDGLGKIGVLVNLESEATKDELTELGEQLAMQIAASKPEFLDETSIPADKLEVEKEIAKTKAKEQKKPDNIIEKIVDGAIKKYIEENTLLNQVFIMDETKKVKDLLADFEKKSGKSVKVVEYVLYVLGEGIEKEVVDFADEVNSMIK